MTKKVYIKSFGCQMNVRDSEVISGLLKKAGFNVTSDPEKAGVVIFNTCSVRQHAEDKVWSEIGRVAKRLKNKPFIGLAGCMAQNYKEEAFQRMGAIDFVVGPSDIHKIPAIIRDLVSAQKLFEKKIWETDAKKRPEEIYHSGFYQDKKHAYVVISEGCSNFCSYCVVPYVRGPLRNRRHPDVLREIEEAVSCGITSITLLGQNVNAYEDAGINFIDLLTMIDSVKGLKDFSFITSHPKDTSVSLFKAMAALPKLKKHLHLPVQSGSDRILGLMNRHYTGNFYLKLIDDYRKIVPGGALATDIIVGFPTERVCDFEDTRQLVEKARFDAAYIFKYSPRPHTKAEGLIDDVSKEEKEKRHSVILQLQKSISKRKKCAR